MIPSGTSVYRRAPGADSDTSQVREFMLSLVKLRKGLRLYMANNEMVGKLQADCRFRLARYFEDHASLPLAVTPTDLMLGPEIVYSSTDKTDSLAFLLHREGVRNIIIHPGAEDGEILDLVGIFNSDLQGTSEDDIVTLLWERSFEHIEYVVVEDIQAVNREQTIRELLQSPTMFGKASAPPVEVKLVPEEITPPVYFPVHSVMLTDEEQDRLRVEVGHDDGGKLYEGMFDILAELAARRLLPPEAGIMETTAALFDSLYESGDLGRLAALLLRLDDFLKGEFGGSEELERMKKSARAALSAPEKASRLKNILNLKCHDVPSEVAAFATNLLPSAARPLLAILPEVAHSSYRRAICDFIAGDDDCLKEVGALVRSPRPIVVRDAVYILGRMKTPGALEHLSRTIRHQNRDIRMESVGALSHHRGPAGEQLLLHALLDPDIDVRTAALRTIVGMGSNSVMNSLLSFTESDDFKVKDLQEKKRFFLALARLGGHLLVPHFEEILSRKKFFERTADTEQKICAIHALESVGSDRARELLEEVARTQSGAIKERAAEALKTLRLRSANGSQAGRP